MATDVGNPTLNTLAQLLTQQAKPASTNNQSNSGLGSLGAASTVAAGPYGAILGGIGQALGTPASSAATGGATDVTAGGQTGGAYEVAARKVGAFNISSGQSKSDSAGDASGTSSIGGAGTGAPIPWIALAAGAALLGFLYLIFKK